MPIIITGGSLFAVGYNRCGQLGLGDNIDRNVFTKVHVPKQVTTSSDSGEGGVIFTAVSGYNRHTIALDDEGNLWSCGSNKYGQLGLADNINRNVFTKVHVPKQVTTSSHSGEGGVIFTAVSCVRRHTIALDDKGNIWSCGNYSFGLSSIPDNIPRNVFTAISRAADRSIALDIEGNLWSCDHNYCVQLGLSNEIDSEYDVIFTAISSSLRHTMALDIEGNLWACGHNYFGQLGLLDNIDRDVFTKIPSKTKFTAVYCCNTHTMAIDDKGNLWTCGYNEYGQLGLSDNIVRYILTKISCEDTCFIEVSSGYLSTMALDIEGSLWTCGDNLYGELGLSDNINRNVLTKVHNLTVDVLWNQQKQPKRRIKSAASMV